MNVLDIKACKIERIGHLAVAVDTLFADNSRFDAVSMTVTAQCDAS